MRLLLLFFNLFILFFFLPGTIYAQECDPPGSQCYACETDWCPNGEACAAGHSYCIWDPEGNYCSGCVEEFNNCSSQCQIRTCDTDSICRTYWGPNFCCPPGPGNNVCNYKMGCKRDDSGGNCSCPQSDDAPTCGWVIDRITQGHPCNWKSECCNPQPPPPPSCNYNREYNECNSNCNGTNYPDDHLVRVTEYTNPSGSVCRYDCNDLGRIAGQCGVPGDSQLYSCSNGACVPDAGGFTTDPSCGGQCTNPPPPPPPQKYACSGGSCVVNANGPYTASNCNNACTPAPGGCSVSWSLSNENPPPNSSIQVKVRGLSDPNGWPNVQLWMDGGSNIGSWGGIENPWPTFVYNNVPTRSGGGHTLEFRTNNGSRTCAPSKTFTTLGPPTNLQVSGQPSCSVGSYSVNFSWQNTNSVLWLDVGENPGFPGGSFTNKNVSNQTSTNSSGFTSPLTLNPGRTYYWRLWNGSVHTVGPSFSAPFCVPSPPTLNAPSCPAPGTTASLSWNASSDATYYMLRADNMTANGWNGLCNGNQNPGDICEDIAATSKNFSSITNNTYNWWVHACNIAGCSSLTDGADFTCQPPPPPPCSNTTPGTNQLKGCLWDGLNFNISDGNAPDGILATAANFLIPPPGNSEYTATALWQDWEQTSPNDFVGADQFSARWKGTFNFKKGKYTFKIGSDDGARLKVDNNPITLTRTGSNPPDTNSWVPQSWDGADKWQAEIPFNIDRTNVPMELEYYEDGGNAKITLYWTFTPPPAPTSAWIYVDGDVHSNGRIRIAQ